MIPISKALKLIERETPRLGTEKVALADAVGRVLAENIFADMDLPPFDRSMMDGYAVIAADTANAPVSLKIVGESAAGHGWDGRLKRGQAVRIMTGARVPAGADAVQRLEVANEADGAVEISEPVRKGMSIVRRAAEIKRGAKIFSTGEIVSENMIAALASFGYSKVKVGKRPTVAILGTGSEIVDISRRPGPDQIRNSNSIMLDVLSRRSGGQTEILPMAADDLSTLKTQIAKCKADVLIITGGVSVGKYDLTKQALNDLNAEIHFEKVRLKPGKPAVFARLAKMVVFGLPGNPVSAAVTFHLFVRKALFHMQGSLQAEVRKTAAVAGAPMRAAKERDTYIPVRLAADPQGRLVASPVKTQGSSDLIGLSRADALVFIKAGKAAAPGEIISIVHL